MTRASNDGSPSLFLMTELELRKLLGALGHNVTRRALTDWREKGLLPGFQRIRGRTGRHGALFGWTDPDILLQAHTVCTALDRRRLTDLALLFTWFAGFEYPTAEVRRIWQELAEHSWRAAVEFLFGGPFGDDEADWVVDTVLMATGRRHALQNAITAARLAPVFPGLPTSQLQDALDEFCQRGNEAARDQLRALLKPEQLASMLRIYNDEFATVAWKTRIAEFTLSDLREAHHDLQFLGELYRCTLNRLVVDVVDHGARHDLALAMLPVFVSWVGWLLVMLDLALRRHGMDEEVLATGRLLREASIQDFARRMIAVALEEWHQGEMDSETASARFQEAMRQQLDENPELQQVRADVAATGEALVLVWKGKWKRLLDYLNGAVN